MEKIILGQGAEAIITLKENVVTKERTKKSYRIPELDEKIRKLRTRGEAKILKKIHEKIRVPKVISESEKTKKIEMEFIDGEKLSSHLNNFEPKDQKEILKKIGKIIAKLHDSEIIHGDLTTSNMILKEGHIYLIDFGLSYVSHKLEDKSVDIHLLKQALEAKHFENWEELYRAFENEYKKNSPEGFKVLERLKAVEKRGRYKH